MLTPEEIRKIRTEILKISQEQFASLLNVSVKTISRWENGEASPTGLYLEKLKKVKEIVNNPSFLNSLKGILGSSLGILGASMFVGGITNLMFLSKAGFSDKVLETLKSLLGEEKDSK
ncbi:MAG: helix-turn-helix domain-containing protein [Candidatus Woesearchaeota archaeon]